MANTWTNWSGSLQFTPASIAEPNNEEELAALVRRAAEAKGTVRVAGAGHSSSSLVATDDVLVSLAKFQGLVSHDSARQQAVLRSGMTVHDAGKAFLDVGLATHNTGDVDVQTLAGAIGTGTHGTGKKLQNLSAMLIGARMVNGLGQIVEYNIEQHPDILRALRLSLGILGIFTTIRVQLVPAFQLHRREWCAHIDNCLANLDHLIEENRNFDFYWYPRSDEVKLRTLNSPGAGSRGLPFAKVVKDYTGWSNEVLPRHRELKFDEMEYALPQEAGIECFREVRERVKKKWRKIVGWRVLYRTIAADDAYLSSYYRRDSVTISLHQNAGLSFWEYFTDIEPIFRAYGGRPHWGKKHTLKAHDLRPLYPEWDRFLEIRRMLDPEGVFLNSYLRELLLGEVAL